MIPEILLVVLMLAVVGYLIINKHEASLCLIIGGLILLTGAWLLGHPLYEADASTGFGLFDVLMKLKDTIVGQLGGAGLVIMILFGYSAYMSKIGANQMTVDIMVKPLKGIKHKALFVPVVFLLGNLMSLVVPSASSLAIILMSILYPILVRMGISAMTAAGVIACTATIMPTPLGADNVIAAETLGYGLIDYVAYNAKIALPVLAIMALAHFLWQNWCDKKEGEAAFVSIDQDKLQVQEKANVPTCYALFPLLPLILILGVGIAAMFLDGIKMDIFVLTFLSFLVVLIVEIIRNKSLKIAEASAKEMFVGMGRGFSQVVMLVVGGSLFTNGIQALGLIDALTASVEGSTSAGLMVMLLFAGATMLFGILAGGGLSMFYAVIALIPGIAAAAGVDGIIVALPMQLIANLARGISPVAAVIMIVAATVGVAPTKVLKRTAIPSLIGIAFVMLLSVLLLPY